MKENMELSIQERILRAFLDLVILRTLLHQPMTAYEIDNAILKKFGVKRSPNVVYTKLAAMERKGLISCSHSKHGRSYSITEKGRKKADTIPSIVEEIQKSASILLC
ncbi:PadR family transcriptional regulator [Candidatus Bathyarchaeota archaeon A05DMB-2]|nr:PadR family transcriptional regulator [Candidatus Bathyarchaeota archaeon A05DMB-2]